MDILEFNESYRDDWQRIVARCGSLYHDIRWKQVIAEAYHLQPAYYLIKDNGKTIGIFPGFNTRKNTVISMPYLPFAGLAVSDPALFTGALHELLRANKNSSFTLKQLSDTQPANPGYVTMIKKLEATKDEEFNKLSSRLKNKVRNACKVPFELKKTSVAEFYPIYLKATNALGTPGHSIRFFNLLKHAFDDICHIHNLILDGKSIGVIFEIDYKGTRHDLWIFSLKQYLEHQPNIYLYWKTLEDSVNKGLSYYDFGRSTYEQGTYVFKKQWGAKPVFLNYTKNQAVGNEFTQTELPPLEGGRLPKIWSKLPHTVTNRLGPVLRKYIY